MTELFEKASELKDYCTLIRRKIHQNPEVGFTEFETTGLVKSELAKMGIECLPLDIPTGCVAVIKGEKGEGPTIALRADMDALPIPDKSGKSYASKKPLASHACGHDGHTAALLGVAKLLNERKKDIRGTIKLIFQPAEETLHGSCTIIDSHAVDDVELIAALHTWPYLKVGQVGAWKGFYMASSDRFDIRINGISGHGARPHQAVNPIPAASAAVLGISSIVSNEIDCAQKAVISICTINGGNTFNVIPDYVEISGTVRTLDEKVRKAVEEKIKRTAKEAALMFSCTADFKYTCQVPVLYNDPQLTDEILDAAGEVLGKDAVQPLSGQAMGSEDFSLYSLKVPKSVYIRLGVAKEDEKEIIALHNSRFDFNDDALPYAIAVMTEFALKHNA